MCCSPRPAAGGEVCPRVTVSPGVLAKSRHRVLGLRVYWGQRQQDLLKAVEFGDPGPPLASVRLSSLRLQSWW